ncbi:MAG: TonB-dependent receptor [Bacteroidota bacterium]
MYTRIGTFIIFSLAYSLCSNAQTFSLSGKISELENGKRIVGATVCIHPTGTCIVTDENGGYIINKISPGNYTLTISNVGFEQVTKAIFVSGKNIKVDVVLSQHVSLLDSVNVRNTRQAFGFTRLKDVDGANIYAGKKSEVIVLRDIIANAATNNSRQIYSKVAGLNIWENDGGAGIQLAIGGRGLNPNRTSNFNTRQNGYDMSADALGYPESYYTPPAEMMERIEIVRGASSLQYGTQFGGIINFKLNTGPDSQKVQLVQRLTGGSWGFFNTSTSVGGTVGKLNYYAFYQHKSGDGWRSHSHFNVNTGYFSATYKASSKLSVTVQYTHMDYLERQPGGLNDVMFATDPRQITKQRNWFKVRWNLGAILVNYDITRHLKFDTRLFGLSAERSALGAIYTVIDPGGPRQYRTDTYKNWGNESRLIYTYHIKKDYPSTLLAGIRYYEGHTDRQIGNGNDGSGGSKPDFAFSKTNVADSLTYSHYTFPNHNTSLFAENIFRVTPKLSIIPGLRYEKIVTEANGFYNSFVQDRAGNIIYNQPINENRNSKRSFLIGGIGVSYNQNNSLQLYANLSQNYRSINFNDMSIVNPNYRVDPNLHDEKGYSADIGARGHIADILNYDVSIFAINYNNRIGIVQKVDTASTQTYQYTTNIAQSRNIGIETFAEADIWKLIKGDAAKMKLSIFSTFAYIDARYVNSKEPAYQNKKVEFVPDIILKSGITLKKNRFSATAQYSYTSRQFSDATNATAPSNNGINGLVPAYYVIDLTVDYKLSKTFMLSGSLNNLTNHYYYTRRADSYPGPGIIPADARSFYLTLQIRL